jgi:hypothetical protein
MLTTESGRLAYYSNWFVEDSWGLNTPRFAHHLIDAGAVAAGRYDLIVAHCDLSLLSPAAEHRNDGTRTWDHQCQEITGFINAAHYQVFLVPFLLSENAAKEWLKSGLAGKCGRRRFDIYAIRPDFRDAGTVRHILLEHHAIPYGQGGDSGAEAVTQCVSA